MMHSLLGLNTLEQLMLMLHDWHCTRIYSMKTLELMKLMMDRLD